MIKAAAAIMTQRELVLAAIVLKRFHLNRGQYPKSLDALTPEFLPELPRDWMAGRPLTYRQEPDDSFLLYSWGEDRKDDGGVALGPNWEDGPDWVWLHAVPPEEAVPPSQAP